MDDQGYIPIARKFFYSDLWREDRELSKAEAWLDLLFLAKFKPEKQIVEGRCLSLNRGELVASVRYASLRWRWSKSKVERFYEMLRECRRIETRTETGITIVSICNYRLFNDLAGRARDSDGDSRGTVAGQSRDNIEEGNKVIDRGVGREVEAHPSFPKTVKDAVTIGNMLNIKPEFTEHVYNKAIGRGGRDSRDVLIRNFRGHLQTELKYERERIEKEKHGTHQRNSKQGVDRNQNTANAGRASDYDGVGAVVP